MNPPNWGHNYLRGSVEEVDPEAKSSADGGDGVGFRDDSEDVAERGGAESDAAELKARVAQRPEL